MANSSPTKYWLAAPDDEIVDLAFERIKRFYEFLSACAYSEKISKSMAYYAGGTLDDGHVSWKINRGGEQGEVLFSFENHYRSIAQALVNLTTAQRPAVQVMAKNQDAAAINRAATAKGVIDYYLMEQGLEEMLRKAVEIAVTEGEAYILSDWDHLAGEVAGRVNPLTSQPEQAPVGDVRFRIFHPFDVVRDVYAPSYRDCNWKIIRTFVNKFELAARYPEVADRVIDLGPGDEEAKRVIFDVRPGECDLIAVWELYAERSPAIPDGRFVRFTKGIWLEGGALAEKKIPLYRMAPGELMGTPFGYSPMFDLLGPQETVNGLDTSMLTNQLGRGIGNMLVPRAANVSVDQFSTSMNSITFDGEKEPKPLEMPATPREFFEYKKDKIAAMEVLSGVNSVVRGNPSENVGADASGSKLALLQATATQQNSGTEREYVQLIRNTTMGIVRQFRARGGANTARTVRIVGKNAKYQVKDFTSEDFADVEDIDVDIGNPLTRQISGRMAMADRLVELGLIKPENMSGYITLMMHGTLDPMIQGQQVQNSRIEQENENLLEGKGAHVALLTDPHWVEIPRHLELLDNPDLRQNTPEAQKAQDVILQAVQQHIDLFKQMPPELVAIRGGAAAMELWNLAMGVMPGAPPGGGAAPAKGGESTASVADQMAPEGQAAQPSLPNQPTNPATGQSNPTPGVTDE